MRKMAMAAALAAVCTQASAVIVADGKLGTNEYQLGFQMQMLDSYGASLGYAKLYFGENGASGDQFLYIQLPTAYVDNTYGNNDSWSGTHLFTDLLSGDKQSISWGGNTLTMDYLECTSNASATCSAGYASGGGGGTSGFGTASAGGATGSNTYNDGSFSGTALAKGSVKDVATSLEYNLKNVNSGATTNWDSSNPNWIKEVGYEVEFAPGTFNAADWIDKAKAPGLISISDPSVSPSKKAFKDYLPPTCIYGCANVPEPGTNVLLGVGAMSLLWFARRRRDGRASDALGRLISS
jgi:hypothetical protein